MQGLFGIFRERHGEDRRAQKSCQLRLNGADSVFAKLDLCQDDSDFMSHFESVPMRVFKRTDSTTFERHGVLMRVFKLCSF